MYDNIPFTIKSSVRVGVPPVAIELSIAESHHFSKSIEPTVKKTVE